jgi:macrolide resistance protein
MAQNQHSAPLYGVMVASGFSLLGNAVAAVALPWFVLTLTDSAAWTGAAAAAGMAPLVVGAFLGGPIVDRFGSRRVAVVSDLVGAASVAAIPLLFLFGQLGIGALLALIVVGSLLDGPAMTAQDARLPDLARLAGVPIERVTAIDELLENAAIIFGPPIAGLSIAAFGMEQTLFITAGCSFAAAIINAFSLPRHRNKGRAADARSAFMAGARFLIGDRLLRTILCLAMVVLAVFGALNAVVVPALYRAQGGGALDLGLFMAAAGAGAGAAALVFAGWGHRANGRLVLLLGLASAGFAIGGVALLQTGPLALVAAGLLGLSTGALGPLVNAQFLRRAPSAIRGSVLGATTAVALVAAPIAVLAAGLGVELLGARMLLAVLSLTILLVAVVACFSPALAELGLNTRSKACDGPTALSGHGRETSSAKLVSSAPSACRSTRS